MLPKPYIIRGDQFAESCVVKISYGLFANKEQREQPKPYVYVKCKSLPKALKNIENSLNAFIRGGKNNPGGLYFHLFNYVKEHPDQIFKVETVVETENAYTLLKTEQQLLDAAKGDPLCLNNQLEAYIPAYDEGTMMYGWIPRQSVAQFHKFLKARKKKNTPKKAKKASLPAE